MTTKVRAAAQTRFEQPHEIRVALCKRHLADADAEACANGRQLRQIAVGAEGRAHQVDQWYALAHGPHEGALAVKADGAVLAQVLQRFRRAVRVEIAPVRVEPERYAADPAGDQSILFGCHHAHGDIGFLAQKVPRRHPTATAR